MFYKLNVENWKLCQLLLGRDIRHKFPTLHLQLAEREGAAVKPARAEAAGDADLQAETDPERSEGARPNKK